MTTPIEALCQKKRTGKLTAIEQAAWEAWYIGGDETPANELADMNETIKALRAVIVDLNATIRNLQQEGGAG